MSFAPQRNDGRSIFRRDVADGKSARAAKGARVRTAPALVPLVVGFVLLLTFVFALGVYSTLDLDRVSADVLDLQRTRGEQLRLLQDIRAALIELDNEARARANQRAGQRARGGFIPPFALRLRGARSRAEALAPQFKNLPTVAPAEKEQFARDLNEYIALTESPDRYDMDGFKSFTNLERRLDAFIAEANAAQGEVGRRMDEWQEEAGRRIRTNMTFALLAGFGVAAGTIWEVQRRFRQVRASLDEAQRERESSAQVLEGMPSAVATLDHDRRLRSANKAFFQLFPRAVVGAGVGDSSLAPEKLRMIESVTAEAAAHEAYRGRWQLTEDGEETWAGDNGDGAAKTFDAYVAPLKLDSEAGMILTLVDVTEATAAERALQRQASLAAVGQAAAQVAHEIKNPLGSIRLGVSLLREMTDGEEQLSTINLIERGIQHLNKLTIDVTQYSRERPLELAETDLHELLDASLELVRDKTAEKEIRIERHYAQQPLRGSVDADQLRQVFVNLLANAIDASAAGSSVRIATDITRRDLADGRYVHDGRERRAGVTIADEGSGMTEETRAHLFEPFFTTKKRGTGLGLALSKKIVEQHGGTIEVESKPGEGSRFTVRLPLS